ncbi:Ppx/GppA phosphatase family protein [Novosphingobium rosa]|uniref:Ppx/GppA phosphatase family protein n=1 Tax=Novosphingobium rosa TaxID=76978 RepID=UPI000A01594C|nr:Ppx/GppA phosphatase family protein [Novosphingobium rosa]
MADQHPPAKRNKVRKHGGKRKRHARKTSGASTPSGANRATAGGRPDGVAAPQAPRSAPGPADNKAPSGAANRAPSGAGQPDPGTTPGGSRRRADSFREGSGRDGGRPAPSRQTPPRVAPIRPTSTRQSYAAIDLGTNNCRLLIARPAGDSFVVVDAFSRVVRLGEGLAQTGRLSDQAMDRALNALRVCAEKLKRRNVHLARSVATEACRRASNGPAFIERVRAETGIRLDIISAREEARLAVLGCHILLEPGPGPALVFDIGGGSTELVLVETVPGSDAPPIIRDWVSVPWGVVSLTETCVGEGQDEQARIDRYAEMRGRVDDSFADFARRIDPFREAARESGPGGPLRLLGTSGTVTTLASVHLDLPQYDRSAVDGVIVPAKSMHGITTRLSTMALARRRELPCIGRERADLVVAGCAILESILELWPAHHLGVADRGIREGILRSLIGTDDTMPANAQSTMPGTMEKRR